MSDRSAAPGDVVNAFPVGDALLFKHYFEGSDVFERLRPYYNRRRYRFEVPADEFTAVRRFLLPKGYDVSVVDRPAEYCVVVRQYTAHPEDIFEEAVYVDRVDEYNCFLLKDRDAVEAAVAEGATRFTDTSLSFATESLASYAEGSS